MKKAVDNSMSDRPKIAVLDGVRGIAIIMVLFHHAVLISGTLPTNYIECVISSIGGFGATGVDLFFMLSGFLITGILIDTKEAPRYYRNFYLRRILRIFPLYYLFLFLIFFVSPILSKYIWFIKNVSADKIWYWAYLANFKMFFDNIVPSLAISHTWSLCIEEQFYMFWPIIVGLIPVKSLPRVIIGIILLSIGVRALLDGIYHCSEWQIRVFTFARLDIIALGGLLAALYRRKPFHSFSSKPKKIGFILLTMAGLITIAFTIFTGTYPFNSITFFYVAVGMLYAGVMVASLASVESSILHKILSNKLLMAFGKYSYSIYLFHVPVCVILLKTVFKYLKTCSSSPIILWCVFFIMASVISFGIAFFTYHYYEKYFLKLKDVVAPILA